MDPISHITGMLTSVVALVAIGWAITRVFHGPVGQAIARRISGRAAGPDPELLHEVEELRHQIEQVHQRLLDAEERLDFSERLLSQRSEGARPTAR